MNHQANQPARWLVITSLLLIYFIWGSTYLGIRVAIETIPPFLMASGRFILAGGLLIGLTTARGAARPTGQQVRSAAIVGTLMLAGGSGGVTWVEQRVPSSFAALMIGAMPLWIVVLNWLVYGAARPNRRMTAGLMTGFFGVVLLAGPLELLRGDESVEPLGVFVLVLSAISWAWGSLYSRRAVLPDNPLLANGLEMFSGGLVLVIAGTISGEWGELDPGAISLKSAGAFAYLTLIGSLVAFTAYLFLLRNTTPARAASYAYVNPVVAVILGWTLAGEAISARMLVAAAIIISSVVLITSLRAQQSDTRPASRPEPEPGDPLPECGAAK